jgi:hypothetical protein
MHGQGRYSPHHGPAPANLFCGGKDFEFLVSDGTTLKLVKDSAIGWEGNLSGEISFRYATIQLTTGSGY